MEPEGIQQELEKLHPQCWGWALSCCDRRREEAEDVLQASYLKVLDGRARFGGRSSFKTWLFGVIRHTAREHRRARLLRGGLPLFRAAPVPSPEQATRDGERNRKLRDALARLSRRQREVVELVFYHDLTVVEAAQTLGISVGSARVHYDRGKRRLRSRLQEEP